MLTHCLSGIFHRQFPSHFPLFWVYGLPGLAQLLWCRGTKLEISFWCKLMWWRIHIHFPPQMASNYFEASSSAVHSLLKEKKKKRKKTQETTLDLEEMLWDRWPVPLLALISIAVLLSVGSKLSHTSRECILFFSSSFPVLSRSNINLP